MRLRAPASGMTMTMTSPFTLPVLYSFRRCPYAMRARLAIYHSDRTVELRNILLKEKPAEMLAASPKGTVPVLVHPDGTVLDESLDIMLWALDGCDPAGLLPESAAARRAALDLIAENDGPFKEQLDRYKYHVRFPEAPQEAYRAAGETFLATLEARLTAQHYLLGAKASLADIAIFPYIRQFANTDPGWFAAAPYPALQAWLRAFVEGTAFLEIMKKALIWRPGSRGTLFGGTAAR